MAILSARPASAELIFHLSGYDRLNVSDSNIRSFVSYDGVENVRIAHTRGEMPRMRIDAQYRVDDGKTVTAATAHAGGVITADGGGDPPVAQDPAYLTLLTQPFAIVLDPQTLLDVDHLLTPLPFQSNSPLTGSQLHGTLTKGKPGTVAGFPVAVLQFRAEGPIHGSLPYNESVRLAGTVHMDGIACYRRADGLLLSLVTIVHVAGRVGDTGSGAPIEFTYQRSIRAVGQARASVKADANKK